LSILKSIGIYTATIIFSKGVAFLFLPLLTFYLSPEDYGVITLYTNSILFLTPFIYLSITTSVSTDYFKYDESKFRTYFSTILILPLVAVLVCLIILLPFDSSLSKYLGIDLFYLYLIPILVVSGLFNEIILIIIRNKDQPYLFAVINLIKTIVDISLSALFIIVLKMNWQGRVLSWLIIGGLILCYCLYYLRKNRFLTRVINPNYLNQELKYSIPMVISQFAIFMVISSDKFFIAKFLNVEEVGIYGVASQISFISFAFYNGIMLSFQPYLFKQLSLNSNYEADNQLAKRLFQMIVVIFFICFLVIIISPYLYYYFIGDRYLVGEVYVKWIVLAYFFWFIYGLLVNFLYFHKLKKIITVLSIFNIIICVALNYFFVQYYKLMGAVIALNCSTFLSLVILFIFLMFNSRFLELKTRLLNNLN